MQTFGSVNFRCEEFEKSFDSDIIPLIAQLRKDPIYRRNALQLAVHTNSKWSAQHREFWTEPFVSQGSAYSVFNPVLTENSRNYV